jgi:uncharacterized OB-fold protein
MDEMEQVAVADGLFTWPSEEPRLLGAVCASCSTTTFPSQDSCPRCTGNDMVEAPLPRQGRLWTFTVQGFCPKDPYAGPAGAEFVPYGVGYVELGQQVMVEARLTENDPERLSIGAEMELVIVPFRTDETGRQIMTYAFRPLP